ncbi:MAG: hypothetical protein V7720_04010 [Halioglobus sp.]
MPEITERKSIAVKIGEPHITNVELVRKLWRELGRCGPESSFSETVRYLILMGCEFEKYRDRRTSLSDLKGGEE